MSEIKRIELGTKISGPKTVNEPLEIIEKELLDLYRFGLSAQIEAGLIQRCIDYMGNYFLLMQQEYRE